MKKRNAQPLSPVRLAQLRALADPTRLKVMALLKRTGCCSAPDVDDREAGMCLCDLQAALGLSQPTVTHHLKVLREADLVDCRRVGTWLHCRLNHRSLNDLGMAIMALSGSTTAAAPSESHEVVP